MKKEMNKNDRRYAFTHNTIKDAMLELLHSTDFGQITVSSLCRQAQVGRATFYTHFDNLIEVVEELVEDAINSTQRSIASNSVDGIQELVRYLDTGSGFKDLEKKSLLLPVCQRVADNPKYNVLFRDSTLSDFIMTMIYRQERDYQVRQIMKYNLTETEADMLFIYMFSGSFSVNRKMGWKKGDDWAHIQKIILNFVSGGMEAVKNMK